MNRAENWTICLMATEGMKDFVESSLRGIRGCGIDPAIVHVVVPEAAAVLRRNTGVMLIRATD